jgi:hypothetical protein
MFKDLADVIRKFDNIELLASEIESLEYASDVEDFYDLTSFLRRELELANE